MATSKCIKCDNSRFELKEATISGSAFRMCFVQCANCGGVISVVEMENIGAQLHKIAKKIGA
jgi:predicted nucleic-acid-binding Zn-ribbon protein